MIVTVEVSVVDGLDEFVGHIVVVAFLHGGYHVLGLLALAFNEQVVCHLHAVPALVAVHCVVATDDRGNLSGRLFAVVLQLFDKALTRAGVGVAAIHEAVEINLLEFVFLGDVAKSKDVVER